MDEFLKLILIWMNMTLSSLNEGSFKIKDKSIQVKLVKSCLIRVKWVNYILTKERITLLEPNFASILEIK